MVVLKDFPMPRRWWMDRAQAERHSSLLYAHDIATEIERARHAPALVSLYEWADVLAAQVHARVYWLVYKDLRQSRRAFLTRSEYRRLVEVIRAKVYARWNGPTREVSDAMS